MTIPPVLGVFDLETTGVDTETDRIVTAFVGTIDTATGALIQGTAWLVDPGIVIPEGATAVHGITTEHARQHGQPAAFAVERIATALAELHGDRIPLAIFNAPFDLTMLDREIRRHEVGIVGDIGGPGGMWWDPRPIVDAFVLDKAVDRYRKGKRTLTAIAELHGVPTDGAHGAEADAIMAGRVALAIIRARPELDGGEPDDWHRWSVSWSRRQREGFQDYLRSSGGDWQGIRFGWPIYGDGERIDT